MTRQNKLAELGKRARAGIDLIYRRPDWVRPSQADLDVAIIGGGQSGVGLAFALRQAGISRVHVYDAAPVGQAGVWATTARMESLRTEKSISALDQGIAELSFRNWFDTLEGRGAFDAMTRIPRLVWADYLQWLQSAMGVEVQYESRLVDIRPDVAGVALRFLARGVERNLTARRLVLATGVDGLGAPFVPEAIVTALPKSHYGHTADPLDIAALKGRRVIVVGAASSAFDAVASALEAGAREVHLLARSQTLATVPPSALAKHPALYRPFRRFPDALKWKIISEGRARGHAPPATVERARRHGNFHLHQGVSLDKLRFSAGEIRIDLPDGAIIADYVIAGTGYQTDIRKRPELHAIEPHLRLWRDALGSVAARSEWGLFPYLDADLAFQSCTVAGDWIARIHAFNYSAVLSHGYHVGDIGSHADCVARLVEGVSDRLFAEEASDHLSDVGHGASSEFTHPSFHPTTPSARAGLVARRG